MSKFDSLRGFLKTFWWLCMEEWKDTDRKILRIIVWALSFVVFAFFWLYFFQNISPFG